MSTIFISHRSSDNTEAKELKAWLASEGHAELFLDFDPMDGIPAGVDWEQRLYRELRRCQGLLIVLTPAWLESKWCSNELAIAREKGKAVFVARVKPCSGGPIIPSLQEIDLTTDRAAGLAKLARGLKEHGLDPADAFTWNPNRPIYPGLTSFDVDDAAIFFGRENESMAAAEAMRRLRLQSTGSPKLLLITGASGSGKSSLMRAGLLSRLRKDPANWIITNPFRHGGDPILELGRALAFAYPMGRRPSSPIDLADRLRRGDAHRQLIGMADELQLAWNRQGATLVLALDQAEELLVSDAGPDAAAVLDLLREALTRSAQGLMVVATIRSDRLGAWQQHGSVKANAGRAELAFEAFPLGPMPMERLGNIVRRPAEREGLVIDDDLVDALKSDTGTPDALPLLAYTLRHLHELHGADQRLTLQEYESIGRLEGSVRTQAEATIDVKNLDAPTLDALRDAFVPGLVRATEGGSFVKASSRLAALPDRTQPLLRRLCDEARLLVLDHDREGQKTIEIAHEALLRVWPLLKGWIEDDAIRLQQLAAIQRASSEWNSHQNNPDFLIHRRDRLLEAEALVKVPRFGRKLDSTGQTYLAACKVVESKARIARLSIWVLLGIIGLIGLVWSNQEFLHQRYRWYTKIEPHFQQHFRPNTLTKQLERVRRPLESFRECSINTRCPKMIVLPAGSFDMGTSDSDLKALQAKYPRRKNLGEDEHPQRTVSIPAFAIAETELTFDEWEVCVEFGYCEQRGSHTWGKGSRPVINVSWDDAQKYVVWLSKATGGKYRLPTEAEWEYAARAGSKTQYSWGNEPGQDNANCTECTAEAYGTKPVGTYLPNKFGLHDMHGNVREWVEDAYHLNYYGNPPINGTAWLEGGKKDLRMIRGGAWFIFPEFSRSANRAKLSPDTRNNFVGFRVARTLDRSDIELPNFPSTK